MLEVWKVFLSRKAFFDEKEEPKACFRPFFNYFKVQIFTLFLASQAQNETFTDSIRLT
jgi:hypothetical protein